MRRAAEAVALLALAGLAVLASCAHEASAATELARRVVASGGAVHTSPSFLLKGTVGQPVVGASAAGRMTTHGFWARGGAAVLDVDDPPGTSPRVLPQALDLGPAFPNPSRHGTRFRLALPTDARIRFGVFDLQGRAAGDLVDRELSAGWHDLAWAPPRTSANPAGVYFARLLVDGRLVATQRVVVTP